MTELKKYVPKLPLVQAMRKFCQFGFAGIRLMSEKTVCCVFRAELSIHVSGKMQLKDTAIRKPCTKILARMADGDLIFRSLQSLNGKKF